jgi:hypothetical protein
VFFIPVGSPFPWKSIWRVKFPSRVVFFGWMAALGKILILDNLSKRNPIVVEWCCMCKRNLESIDHLLLHCELAREIMSIDFPFFGVEWVMLGKVIELMASWRGQMEDVTSLKFG